MGTEPENLVLQLFRDMRAEMATRADLAELRSETGSLRADVAPDFAVQIRKAYGGTMTALSPEHGVERDDTTSDSPRAMSTGPPRGPTSPPLASWRRQS